jgi:hypothetical protein
LIRTEGAPDSVNVAMFGSGWTTPPDEHVMLIEPFGCIVNADHVHVAVVDPLSVMVWAALGAPARIAETALAASSARRN